MRLGQLEFFITNLFAINSFYIQQG